MIIQYFFHFGRNSNGICIARHHTQVSFNVLEKEKEGKILAYGLYKV